MEKTRIAPAQSPPLAGVRVLDLTRLLPGPLASLHLADLGADVIKVEDPAQGDYGRWMGPLQKTQSGWFLAINRNKRSISLDLKSAPGRQALLDLARTADVLIEGFRPGVMARLDLGYDTLAAVNPKLVFCSVSGYGQTGPRCHEAGHDINYCALTGILDQAGSRDRAPAPGNFQIADLAGGALSSVMGILSALYSTARGGPGRHVDIAMADCAGAHNIMAMMEWQAQGVTRARGDGMLTGRMPNYAVYRTQDDRYMAVGALEKQFWVRLCEALELPDLVDVVPPHGEQQSDRICLQARKQLEAVFASKKQADWVHLLAGIDCCTGPVLSLAEAMQDPHLVSRGLFFTAEHPLEGDVTQYACPVKMSGYQFRLDRHAPGLGEHNAELLHELGYTQQQIDALAGKPA